MGQERSDEARTTARRIVQEVLAAHERSAGGLPGASASGAITSVAESGPDGAEPTVLVELPDEPLDPARATARRIVQEILAAHDAKSKAAVTEGPPPLPGDAENPAGEVADPLDEVGPEEPDEILPARGLTDRLALPPEEQDAPQVRPRTGRWVLATVLGAIALTVLLPLAVAALRDLIPL